MHDPDAFKEKRRGKRAHASQLTPKPAETAVVRKLRVQVPLPAKRVAEHVARVVVAGACICRV